MCRRSRCLTRADECADKAGIQFHVLNKSKGPAVYVGLQRWSCYTSRLIRTRASLFDRATALTSDPRSQGYRAQMDRKLYKREMQSVLSSYPNLEIRKAAVQDLVLSPPVEGDVRQPGREVVGLRIGAHTRILGAERPL